MNTKIYSTYSFHYTTLQPCVLCVHPFIPQEFRLEWRMNIIAYSRSFSARKTDFRQDVRPTCQSFVQPRPHLYSPFPGGFPLGVEHVLELPRDPHLFLELEEVPLPGTEPRENHDLGGWNTDRRQ